MATLTSQLPLNALRRSTARRDRRHSLLLATALAPLAVLIHGYHPYAEDGSIYLAGIKRLLHPELYPTYTGFVLAPTRFSLFSPFVAYLARFTHLSGSDRLPFLLFTLHLVTVWCTLYASSALACRCWPAARARAGAALLVACWLGMPVAGTSLLFMDPYLTARSFSTPCGIAALVAALDATVFDPPEQHATSHRKPFLWCAAALLFAATMHPLMAIYASFATLLLTGCRMPTRTSRRLALLTIAVLCFALAGAASILGSHEQAEYLHVALTRTYWFLARWQWYELVGIVAPVILIGQLALRNRTAHPSPGIAPDVIPAPRALAAAAILCAALVTAVALLFCRVGSPSHLIAALQPMRGLQFVYLTLFLVLGGSVAENILRHRTFAWFIAIPLLGGPLLAASRFSTPASRHVELPGIPPANHWVEAFLWARDHTPPSALFALPANYIGFQSEDAQGFRAIAERSALPDYSKDGGETAVAPFLTPEWTKGQAAQADLVSESDQSRRAKLAPLGVSWLVLPVEAQTDLNCPFSNQAVKVCRLP